MNSEKVWLSDPAQGFILGKIVEFAEDGPVVQPIDRFFFTVYFYNFSKNRWFDI